VVEQPKKPASGQNAGISGAGNLGGRYRSLHLVFPVCRKLGFRGRILPM
jgi:hypothetical protein